MQVFNRHQWNEGNFQVGFFRLVIKVLQVNNFQKVSFLPFHQRICGKLNIKLLLRRNNLKIINL